MFVRESGMIYSLTICIEAEEREFLGNGLDRDDNSDFARWRTIYQITMVLR